MHVFNTRIYSGLFIYGTLVPRNNCTICRDTRGRSMRFVLNDECTADNLLSDVVHQVIFHPTEPIVASCGSDKQIFLGEL